MGRSKWLLLMLIPMLCGFDTRNPFRTRGPFKAADFTIGGGSSTWQDTFGPCTSGTDCFCDRVRGNGPLGTSDPVYNTNVFWCEDWDHDAFYATTPTDVDDAYGNENWVSTSGAAFGSGDRGGGSRWAKKYTDTTNGFTWKDGMPSTTCGSVITSVGGSGIGSGPRVWDKDDRWCANAYTPWIHVITEAADYTTENGSSAPTVPGSGGAVVLGDALLAHRNPTNSIAGYHMETGGSFGGTKSQLGITSAIGYESNVVASGVLLDAWKHDEFSATNDGSSNDGLYGFRQTNAPANTFPIQGFIFGTGFDCTTAIAGATEAVGNVTCAGGNLIYHANAGSGAGLYTWPDDFNLNELHCMQAWWDFRTISSVNVKMALDGEILLDVSGINMTGSLYDGASSDGVDAFRFDNYSNRVQYTANLTQSTRRYSDNLVMRDGTPVSCSDIGFPSSYDVTF